MRPNITGYEEELVEAAEAEHGNKTAAINHAIRQTFGVEADDETDEVDPKIERAHRKLWDNCIGHRMELSTATSILAQDMQIDADAIKSTVIPKLKQHGLIHVQQGKWSVTCVVAPPSPDDLTDEIAEVEPHPTQKLSRDEQRAHLALWEEADPDAPKGPSIEIDQAVDTIADELGAHPEVADRILTQIAAKQMGVLMLREDPAIVVIRSPTPYEAEAVDVIDAEIEADEAEQRVYGDAVATDGGRP